MRPEGGAQPHTFSADGRWWWDGQQWQPALSADGKMRWDGAHWVPARRGSPWMWVRRIGSLLLGLLLLLGTGLFGIWAAAAQPIDPVRRDGNLTKFVKDCPVPGDIGDSCAYIDADSFCYRLHPTDFQPALPSLSDRVGQPISFVVDRGNYESSRTVGDPYCNFAVDQVIVLASGQETRYSTRAMTEPEFAGHSRGEIIPLFLACLILLGLLIGWNVTMEVRHYRRRHR